MSNSGKRKDSITDDLLIANGFHKSVKKNGIIIFSIRIPKTTFDFLIIKEENGLFYAPQVQTQGEIKNDIIVSAEQNNILPMYELNSYYQKAIRKLKT